MWGAQRRAAVLRPRRVPPVATTFANAEAQAFVARMATPPPDPYKAAYDQLFGRLKVGRLNGSNLLGAFDVFYVRAAPSAQAALLNLMGASWTATMSPNAPMFHTGYGFTSNGIDSFVEWGGWRPADGVQYQQNSASFGFWSRNPSKSPAINPRAGAITGSPWVDPYTSASGQGYRINDATTTNAGASTTAAGLSVAVRLDAATKRYFRGAAQSGGDAAVASTARATAVMREGNAFAAFAQDQLPFAFAGRALAASEVADLHDALAEYLAAIGWQPLFVAPALAAAPELPAYAARVSLPDAVPTIVAGKGFTCTGATRDPATGRYWVAAFGYNVQGSLAGVAQPHVVLLDADRATVLGVIDLAAIGVPVSTSTGRLQGVALDTSDNTLFVAVSGTIHHIAASTTAPALLGGFASAGVNGLAYDSLRDKLVRLTATGGLAYLNKDGTTTGVATLGHVAPIGDQITYMADLDAFLVTGGANGEHGGIARVGMNDQSYGALRTSALYLAPGNTAIEGIVRDPATKVATVFNDWWYHGSSGALANGSVLVQLPW